MKDSNSTSNPWEVKYPITDAVVLSPTAGLERTIDSAPVGSLMALRATVDKALTDKLDGFVSAPRPLPKLNTRRIYEFPVHCLPTEISAAVGSIAIITQCHPDIAAQVALGYVSLAVQAHVDVCLPWNLKTVPTSLWLVTVGDSSDRKSSADGQIKPVIARWEKELAAHNKKAMPLYLVQLADWEAKRVKIMKESTLTSEQKDKEIGPPPAQPTPPILVSGNPTIEGLRDLILGGAKVQGLFSDDGGTFLGGHSMKPEQVTNTIAVLSQMFSAEPQKKLRAGGNWAIADNYRMNAHLMIQPVIANRFLNDKLFRGQGLLSRFLTAWPDNESLSGERYSQDVALIHYRNVEKFNDILYRILSAPLPINSVTKELQPRVLRFTDEADQLRKEWNDSNQRELKPTGDYYSIKDFVGKGLEQAARIAANLQMFNDPTSIHITAEWFAKATEIVDYYIKQQAESVANGNDPEIVKAHRLYNFLNDESKCDYEYVTTRYLARCSPFRSVDEVRPVIKTLQEFGLLQDAGKGHNVDGYIAKQAWKVNRGYES